MVSYLSFQKIASKALSDFDQGQIVYIRRVKATPNGRDPGTITATSINLKGAAKGASKKYIDAGLAIGGDMIATVAVAEFTAAGFVPETGHSFTVNGLQYEIQNALSVPPAGVPVVYKLIGRRG